MLTRKDLVSRALKGQNCCQPKLTTFIASDASRSSQVYCLSGKSIGFLHVVTRRVAAHPGDSRNLSFAVSINLDFLLYYRVRRGREPLFAREGLTFKSLMLANAARQ